MNNNSVKRCLRSFTAFENNNDHIVMYGVCRPLEKESSFCLGLSTRPVSEVVPEGLIPRFLDLITLL